MSDGVYASSANGTAVRQAAGVMKLVVYNKWEVLII